MIAEAFADIAASFSAAFEGPFHPAKVRTSANVVFDDGGSILGYGDVAQRDCLAQVDTVTESMRLAEGFTERDVRILVLASTLAGGLDTDATIEVVAGPNAGSYSLQSVGRDPMGSVFDCRGRPA